MTTCVESFTWYMCYTQCSYCITYIYICINQFITPAEDLASLAVWSTCINVRHCSTITQRNQEENLNLKSATSLPNQKERTSPTTNQPLWLYIHIPKLQSANRNQPSPSWSGQILCNVQGSSLHRSDKPQLHVTGIFPHDDEIGHTIHWMPRSFIT